MKMNIHIWFNKCQLLIYMSVGKRRQHGANSAGHNWAPNSQLALSSRILHSQNLGFKPPEKKGAGLQRRPRIPQGASALRPLPTRRQPGKEEGPAIFSRNPVGIMGIVSIRWTPETNSNPTHSSHVGPGAQRGSHPVCNQGSHLEMSGGAWERKPENLGTWPSLAAVNSEGWLPGAQPMWPERLQPPSHPGS